MREIPADVLRLVVEATNAGTWLADHQIGSVDFSDRACEIFGIAPGEPVSRDLLVSRIHPDDLAAFDHAGRLAVNPVGDGRLDRTYRVVRPDGVVCWVRDLARTWFDQDRVQPTVSAGMILDVTESAVEIEARQGREREFRRLADSSDEPIERLDRAGRLLFANRAAARILGHEAEPDSPKPLADLGLPAELVAGWADRFDAGQDLTVEHARPRATGEAAEFVIRAVPELTDDGDVESILLRWTDVTEERRSARREAESRERERLAAAAVGGVIYDFDLRVDRMVHAAGVPELLGFTPDQTPAEGDWWRGRVHPHDRADLVAPGDPTGAGESTRRVADYRIRHRRGHYLHVLDRYVLVRDDGGTPIRRIGCAVEVTGATGTDPLDRKAAQST